MRFNLLASATLAAAMAVSAPALAADYMMTTPPPAVEAQPTVCSDNGVLGAIDHRFDYTDRQVLHANLDILDFFGMHETLYEPSDATHLIGRHYCEASVVMNDHQPRRVYYVVESTMGFAGIGDNVTSCIDGLDPWHVYGAYCSTVRAHY